MSEASHAPVNRFGKQAGKLEVNNFVLEQLRTSPKLLQTIIERKVQELENVNENVPLFQSYAKKTGVHIKNTKLYKAVAIISISFFSMLSGVVLALCFIKFGVPVPLAVSLALTFCMIGPITWLNVNHLFDTGGMSHFALAFQEDFEKAVKQNRGFPSIYQTVCFKIAFVVLYYFAFWTTVTEENNQNPMYATFLILLIILDVVGQLINPIHYYFTLTINSLFAVMPKGVQIVDTYAFEMKNILLSSDKKYDDENNENINKKVVDDNNELLAKLEALYRNFKYLRQLNQNSIYDTIAQLNLSAAGILSILCILWGSESESQESKIARVVVGIANALFWWSYLFALFSAEIAGSVRWEQIIRDHFSGPLVAKHALKLDCFRSLQDFKFFLKENHDLRGTIMFGIRVDHHRVSQLLSVLGSAIVVSVGYGVRSLLE
eukprot:g7120.t1